MLQDSGGSRFGPVRRSATAKKGGTISTVTSSVAAGVSENGNQGQSGTVQPVDTEVPAWVTDAAQCLDKHQLDDAVGLYQRALGALADRDSTRVIRNKEKLFAQCLYGLGEVYAKKGRSVRTDDLGWHHMLLQAGTLQQDVIDYCNLLARKDDAQKRFSWLPELRERATIQLGCLSENLCESIEQRIGITKELKYMPLQPHKPVYPDHFEEASVQLHLWCTRLCSYLRHKVAEAQDQNANLLAVPVPADQLEEQTSTDGSTEDRADADAEPQNPARTKVDYERVQKAILHLVRQISADMRKKFTRRRLSEDMLKQTVTGEMMAKFGQTSETADILGLFESAIIQHEYGMNAQDFHKYNDLTGSSDSDAETEFTEVNGFEPMELTTSTWTDTIQEVKLPDDCYDLPGVLTVWRAQPSSNNPSLPTPATSPCIPYRLHSFQEMSPLTETAVLMPTDVDVISDPLSHQVSPTKEAIANDISLLSEVNLKHTLAAMLSKTAEKLQKQEKYRQANELYKCVLGIYQSFDKGARRYDCIADVLKNIGLIHCASGDIPSGCQLMEDAIDLYTLHDGHNANSAKVAEAWYCMGNAYMAEQWKEVSVFEHIMKVVRDMVEREVKMETDAEDDDSDSEASDGDSYGVCTMEAISCYNSALSILSRLRKKKKSHTSLYVDVLTQLADCCIINGEYERAVLCYEEALFLCQNTLGSPSFTNTSHILGMLGTTNFLLGANPKAAMMYETAHVLQQHLFGCEEKFEMAFTLTMLGMNYFVMQQYHKCVAWCLKAFELYTGIFKERIIVVEELKRWFIAQTLYMAGYAYNTLSFFEKSIYYLEMSRNLITKAGDNIDTKQLVSVVKTTADVYAATDEHDEAIRFYTEALDLCVSLGDESLGSTLQNQLLNRIAGVHVSTKEYSTAAQYLEQALDCQKNVQTSIKGDLVGTLHQLGLTYTLAGDIDRAIECYKDSYEAYKEEHHSPGPEMSRTLGNLGMLYHLKYCLEDDEQEDAMLHYLNLADTCYQDAIRLDAYSGVCVQYANFLYQQGLNADAVLAMLKVVFFRQPLDHPELHYNGPEQAVLPDHLLHDLNDLNEVTLDTRVFAAYLAVLCFKNLGLMMDAEDCVVKMCKEVCRSHISLNHTLLGYSLLEMNLYMEAAVAFHNATVLASEHDADLPHTNMWISVLTWCYVTVLRGLYGVWEHLYQPYIDLSQPNPTPSPEQIQQSTTDYDLEATSSYHIRDSGYFEHDITSFSGTSSSTSSHYARSDPTAHSMEHVGPRSLSPVEEVESIEHDDKWEEHTQDEEEEEEEVWQTWESEEVVDAPSILLEALRQSQEREIQQTECSVSQSHISSEMATKSQNVYGDRDEVEVGDDWVVDEEITVETPAALLEALSGSSGAQEESFAQDSTCSYTTTTEYVMPVSGLQQNNASVGTKYASDIVNAGEHSSSYQETHSTYRKSYNTHISHKETSPVHLNNNINQTAHGIRNVAQGYGGVSPTGNNNHINSAYDNRMPSDEPMEEIWETSEETVETPPEILQLLLASQRK